MKVKLSINHLLSNMHKNNQIVWLLFNIIFKKAVPKQNMTSIFFIWVSAFVVLATAACTEVFISFLCVKLIFSLTWLISIPFWSLKMHNYKHRRSRERSGRAPCPSRRTARARGPPPSRWAAAASRRPARAASAPPPPPASSRRTGRPRPCPPPATTWPRPRPSRSSTASPTCPRCPSTASSARTTARGTQHLFEDQRTLVLLLLLLEEMVHIRIARKSASNFILYQIHIRHIAQEERKN